VPIRDIRAFLGSFAHARSGAVGLWLGAAILPITMLVGAATDLRRVEAMRGAMQDASDAAVLAAAKAYLEAGSSNPQRLRLARAAAGASLKGNLDARKQGIVALDWQVKAPAGGGELVLNTTGRAPLAFGGLFGVDTMPLRASAATVVDLRLEIALVLDTTGSMKSNNKIGILKKSTTRLISQLDAAAQQSTHRNPLKIALVPYSNTVRVDPRWGNPNWLDGYSSGPKYNAAGLTYNGYDPAATPTPPPFNRLANYGEDGWAGCVESRPADYDVTDAPPTRSDPDSLFVPLWAPKHPVENRSGNPNHGCGISRVVKLTSDARKVDAAVRGLNADGFTNIPMGLVWGWHALTPSGGPLGSDNAEPYTTVDLVKAVVLMTDGENDLGSQPDEYSGVGRLSQFRVGVGPSSTRNQRRDALDARLTKLCENMKDRGIVIYAVRVEVHTSNDKALRECASLRPDKTPLYWDVPDAKALPAIFDKIGDDLIQVRLAR